MKIVIFETEPREAAAFDALKWDNELVLTEQPLQADNAAQYADADIVSTFIYSKLGRDVLAKLPALKMIATRSTGYDHIDTEYCAGHGVTVSNVPTYGENTVADHILLTMPNVIVTPHSAFNSREAIARIVTTTVSNIVSFLDGVSVNVVAAARGKAS
ncbi:MAG: hypothetical protein P8Y53_07505 [Pseudolabrys sp.]|jgi:lactate dehydrogenase-like 2-hydroxyacid dehydrogenase